MITGRNSVLTEVMEKNGVQISALAEKMFGDAEKVSPIELILEIRERSPKKVEEAILAAGGTERDVKLAKAELKAYQPVVKGLDEARNKAVAEAIAKTHAEHDVYATEAWNKIHAEGEELLKKEEEMAKKAATKKEKVTKTVETILEPVAVAAPSNDEGEVADPFDMA